MASGAGLIGAMLLELLAQGSRRANGLFLQIRNAGWRWRGRSVENVFQNPLAAEHWRSSGGIGRHGQYACLGQDAAALIAGQLDAPERIAFHAWNPVMRGQPRVEERE